MPNTVQHHIRKSQKNNPECRHFRPFALTAVLRFADGPLGDCAAELLGRKSRDPMSTEESADGAAFYESRSRSQFQRNRRERSMLGMFPEAAYSSVENPHWSRRPLSALHGRRLRSQERPAGPQLRPRAGGRHYASRPRHPKGRFVSNPPNPLAPASPTKLPPELSRVIVLLAFSIFLNYADRSTLSIAATLLKEDLRPLRLGVRHSPLLFLLEVVLFRSSFLSPSRAKSCALRAGIAIRRRFGRGLTTSTRLN
jgi:hypothetical protein